VARPRLQVALRSPLWLILTTSLLAACGGSQHDGTTTAAEESAMPVEESAAAEEAGAAEEAVGAVPADPGAEEPDGGHRPCLLPARAPAARQQTFAFQRWLRDQAVGRHITVEGFEPRCGDRDGFLVVRLRLRGESGELLSLGRALEAYYPGSAWRPLGHERLGGPGVMLRLHTEVEIPVGASPRPRCTWDAGASCP